MVAVVQKGFKREGPIITNLLLTWHKRNILNVIMLYNIIIGMYLILFIVKITTNTNYMVQNQ